MKVSIVIPTRNGMPRFARVLDAIAAQRCDVPFDVFCIDTESTDGTWQEIERRGLPREQITRPEFDHGATRNRAIEQTNGDLIVSTVQDATPADDAWLQRLVDAVLLSEDTAGAYSRQLPYDDVNPFLRMRLEHWAAGRSQRVVQQLPDGKTLADLEPMERLLTCAFDDVSSIMRRAVWQRFPHPTRRFGEDVAWGKSVIEAGLSIVFEPRSNVIHSHDDGALAEFKRIYMDHANLFELFGITTVPTLRDALRNSRAQTGVYLELVDTMKSVPESERQRLRKIARRQAFAETFAQWLGARSIRKGPPTGVFKLIERYVTN